MHQTLKEILRHTLSTIYLDFFVRLGWFALSAFSPLSCQTISSLLTSGFSLSLSSKQDLDE